VEPYPAMAHVCCNVSCFEQMKRIMNSDTQYLTVTHQNIFCFPKYNNKLRLVEEDKQTLSKEDLKELNQLVNHFQLQLISRNGFQLQKLNIDK